MEDYFAYYGLPRKFGIDVNELRRLFLAKSKSSHPDFHTHENKSEQEKALEESALNNRAFLTLKDEDKRSVHLLQIMDSWGEESTHTVPQEFLMEMMDLNETLMELELGEHDDVDKVEGSFREHFGTISEQLREAQRSYDETQNLAVLEEVKELSFKKRYLLRVKEKINKFASPSKGGLH